MATVSSHILDSVFGGSAVGIRCKLYRHIDDSAKELVFDVVANEQGRIVESVDSISNGDYELIFQSGDYFRDRQLEVSDFQIVDQVVVRFSMSESESRYHIPVMLSAHSYSVWWSKLSD